MADKELLGRLVAAEHLAVIAMAIVIAADQSKDAKAKGASILRFALDGLSQDPELHPEVRQAAVTAFDELSSRVSETLRFLKP